MSSMLSRISVAVVASLVLATGAVAQDAKKAPPAKSGSVAKVNGKDIPESRVEFVVKQMAAQQGTPDSPELRNQVKDRLILNEVLSQEAAKRGLDKDPETATLLEIERQSILARSLLADRAKKNPIPEATLKAEYDKAKAAAGTKEYHVRHILVGDEAAAKDVVARLKKGEKFDDLAKAKSLDGGSKDKGGDLDWRTPNVFVKEFSDAMTALKKGAITETPVKSQFGWHVIKLEDERAYNAPPYDQVKKTIEQNIQQKEQQKFITELRGKAKIQ